VTPKDVIQQALSEDLRSREGSKLALNLETGLSAQEIQEFEGRFPKGLPVEIRELLAFSSGFEFAPFGLVDFRGRLPFEFEDAFPDGLPLAGDDSGNFWVQDIHPESGLWGAIFFVSHDPPVVVVQATLLVDFLHQIFDFGRAPYKSAIANIKEKVVPQIWADDSYSIKVEDARSSSDSTMSTFARQLPENSKIIDLRPGKIGSGFSFGSHGSETRVQRYGDEPIFAVEG
jgi:hypothetical protein